jgi:hypothetical protein
MKSVVAPLIIVATLTFEACVQRTVPTTLEPVRATAPIAATAPTGRLVVYSAFEVGPPSPLVLDEDTHHHTSYLIRNLQHQILRRIPNTADTFTSNPDVVELAPGAYEIVARATGGHDVTVSVTIAAHATTTVHLDDVKLANSAVKNADLIRIPTGKIVGWLATQ